MPDLSRSVRLVGQYYGPSRTEILISPVLLALVGHLEVVGHRQGAALSGKFEKTISEITLTGKAAGIECGIEGSIAVEQIDVSLTIRCRTASAHPDGAFVAVRSNVQHTGLIQRSFVKSNNPTCVGPL